SPTTAGTGTAGGGAVAPLWTEARPRHRVVAPPRPGCGRVARTPGRRPTAAHRDRAPARTGVAAAAVPGAAALRRPTAPRRPERAGRLLPPRPGRRTVEV